MRMMRISIYDEYDEYDNNDDCEYGMMMIMMSMIIMSMMMIRACYCYNISKVSLTYHNNSHFLNASVTQTTTIQSPLPG